MRRRSRTKPRTPDAKSKTPPAAADRLPIEDGPGMVEQTNGSRTRNETNEEAVRPASPTDLPARSWWAVLRRCVGEFRADNLTDWAAALTYYAVLALFPALIVLVALVGLFGQYPQTTNALIDILRDAGVKSDSLNSIKDTINGIVQNKGGAGALLGFGLVGA